MNTEHAQPDTALPKGPVRPVLLGIAGGIGSGKSTVARLFGNLGWIVSDADADAKAMLDRPDVRQTLTEWWGNGILDTEGRVSRQAVAKIVFSDERERARLEGLIHPLVHQERLKRVDRAARDGSPGVVVDAPLLFEASVDRHCDAVVFVHTPRAQRLERVRETRGWDEAELERRERAQWPVERKKAASRFIIDNLGDIEELRAQVARVAAILTQEADTPKPHNAS